ncbi:MAG: penicillin acylase family protein, partial [Dinghuibacter sp.]|nr:penicillin acylase family protein [Dinghuibacter sp.]
MLKKIDAGFLFPAIVLVVFIAVLSRSMFNTPAIGKFMNPFIGSIQNERGAAKNNTAKIGVTQPVKVHFDNRKVPHIFAASTNDLYAAQGYTVAADRLWQMDFISYVAAGRLSEIYGA